MKPMMRAFKIAIFCIALITVCAKDSNAQTEATFKMKCCFKVGLPSITFKRPKKDCKSGFGLCVRKAYFCFLCNLDGTMPDCPKCIENQTGKLENDIYEMTGKVEGDQISFQIPKTLRDLKENTDEDFSVFYLDEDLQIFEKVSGELKYTIKAGEYKVLEGDFTFNFMVSKF